MQKKADTDFFFRIVVDFESTPAECFDLMADIAIRPEWDEITQSSGIIDRVSPATAVQFMRTKAMWPTAARSALVLGHICRLPDGRLLNVTKSIDAHAGFVQPDGDVRMLANVAGLVIGPHPSGTTCTIHA